MAISATERVKKFFARFENNDHVLILINADPDAMASAMAVKRLLWRKVAGVTISNINVIKRPDNIAMIRYLGIDLIPFKDVDLTRYNRFVIVDSQPDHHKLFSSVNYDVIIDHHPVTFASAPFIDIRPEYGAVASILTEYLRAAKITPSVKLATALFLAIKTDTGNFERKTMIEDIRAFQFLYRHVNMHLAQRIEHGEIRYDFLKYFEYAIQNKKLRKGRLFVHLGSVSNPDVCVLIADFFLRVDKANWSIVSGKYEKTLVIIFRNAGFQKHAGNVAKKAFGQLGSAGGHKSIARAEIPLGNIPDSIDTNDDGIIQQWVMGEVDKAAAKKQKKG